MVVLHNLRAKPHGYFLVITHFQIEDVAYCGVFGTSHGKGPHDGAGTILKKYLWQAQLDAISPKL